MSQYRKILNKHLSGYEYMVKRYPKAAKKKRVINKWKKRFFNSYQDMWVRRFEIRLNLLAEYASIENDNSFNDFKSHPSIVNPNLELDKINALKNEMQRICHEMSNQKFSVEAINESNN